MNESPAIAAARRFLDIITDDNAPSDVVLLNALDVLLAAFHGLPDNRPADAVEPPRQDMKELYRRFKSRFPSLGLYPVCDPAGQPGVEQILVGDAIDDLSDIASTMRDVIWLADNASEAAAHHFYRSLYFHWGRHTRELALLLHARSFS